MRPPDIFPYVNELEVHSTRVTYSQKYSEIENNKHTMVNSDDLCMTIRTDSHRLPVGC